MIIIGIVLAIALALALGVWVGYIWRDRISRQRRRQYLAERFERKERAAVNRGIEAVRAVSDKGAC